MEVILGIILAIIFIAGALVYSAFSWGLVVWKFWYWFLLPVFPAAPAITFVQAVGLMFLISLTHQAETQVLKKEYKEEWTAVFGAVIAPWLTLLIGWIAYNWMY
jgi:hypothetical protein